MVSMLQGPLKAAVYRDENGDLHKMAATCTHLGCVVRASSVAPQLSPHVNCSPTCVEIGCCMIAMHMLYRCRSS